MRPPVAAGPIERKCRESNGEGAACDCAHGGVIARIAARTAKRMALRTKTISFLRGTAENDEGCVRAFNSSAHAVLGNHARCARRIVAREACMAEPRRAARNGAEHAVERDVSERIDS